MLFKKQMKGWPIETPLGDKLGKLDGLILNTNNWNVEQLVMSPSTLKSNVAYDLADITEFDEDNEKIIIERKVETKDLPEHPTHETMPLNTLMGKKVMTSDDEKLKGLYDLDIATQLRQWKVWKLLIQTPRRERRLRVSPDEVESIGESIVLKLAMEDIIGEEEEEEG